MCGFCGTPKQTAEDDPGPKIPLKVWFLEPEALGIGYLDPLGTRTPGLQDCSCAALWRLVGREPMLVHLLQESLRLNISGSRLVHGSTLPKEKYIACYIHVWYTTCQYAILVIYYRIYTL